jgi:hypothetical protein
MSTLTYDNSAVSELMGYVYTAAVSVLILSSIMLTSTAMLNGNISNTVQEEAEEVALYFQLAIEDLLNTVREYPSSSPSIRLEVGMESINHRIQYEVSGTESGLKVTTINPRGGSHEVSFPLALATAITTKDDKALTSSSSFYIVAHYDDNLKVVKLTSAGR